MDQTIEAERRRVGVAFLAIALVAPLLALLPPDRETAPAAVTVYLVLTLGAGMVSRLGWTRGDQHSAVAGVAYVVAVVVLRDAEGGGTSGFAPLLLLPLFWASLVGTRRSLAAVVVAMAFALIVPIVLLGEPRYPVTEWRRAAIWLVVSPVVGGATITLRRRAEEAKVAVEALARTDVLTGCLNRRGLQEVVLRELRRAERTGASTSVALVDLDHFKAFNDSRGHDAGDELLRSGADAWRAALRDTDLLGRWGGEEFVVVLPDTPLGTAREVLDRLRGVTPQGQTCSVGLALVDPEGGPAAERFADALSRADRALYVAKAHGRDRVEVA